jgi:PIN domain nuclease of toxin-antitoxin system
VLLDAFAVVVYLLGEPGADEVEALLRDPSDPAAMSAANVAEVVDILSRLGHIDLPEVVVRIGWLRDGGLEIVPVEVFEGLVAGSLRQRFYDAHDRPLSLADCFTLATAIRLDTRIATADPVLASAARDARIDVLALPDSQGGRS